MRSSTKYYPNANNAPKNLLSNKSSVNSSSIHQYIFINISFFECDDHVIWVENPQKGVYLFMGHLVCTSLNK